MTEAHLPDWRHVLVVVAHPDDESFGLGAVVDAFVGQGAEVDVLCFTQGEASTLGAADDLAVTRTTELQTAAAALGARSAHLRSYPDGALADMDRNQLIGEIRTLVELNDTDGLLVFDPSGITGHPDHTAATNAALAAGEDLALPVLAWTLTSGVAHQLTTETGVPFHGHDAGDIDLVIDVDRATQHRAIACHVSQAVPGSALWRRLELQGSHEVLRWLRSTRVPGTP